VGKVGKGKATGRPSMFDVARLAGVSHQTVSRVINSSPDVAATTREKVLKAIEELGYRPSNSARALASRRSRTIGLVAGGLRFFGPILSMSAVESVARSHGLFTSMAMVHEASCTPGEFAELCNTFDEQNVDAFVFLAPTDVMLDAACRVRVSQPTVIVTSTHGAVGMGECQSRLRSLGRSRNAMVGIDQWGAMTEVVRLASWFGHRRALYFAGPADWRDAATRLEAWRRASVRQSLQSVTVQCSSWDASEAYARMNHIVDRVGASGGRLASLVVTANDSQAVGVCRALHEHGLRIPQDVSVIGFDDMPAMDNMYPPLTTVRPDFERLGIMAMREVLSLLGEGDEPGYAVSSHGVGLIPATLVKRGSLGPVAIR
jgi:DNA-binding LacI/PurR family transcriptional regulator